jgi:hypothetical protein
MERRRRELVGEFELKGIGRPLGGRAFMWYSVRITVRCGRVHSITVSQKAFAEIRGGKEITLQGDGFATEEVIVPDYWEFNTDNLGSVRVYCNNGRQLFRGDSWLSAERVPA